MEEKEIIEKMQDMLAEAEQKMRASQPGVQEAYYSGRAGVLEEMIEEIKREERDK